MIPRDFIDTLLARVDIVDVIDRRVPLKKAGQNYQACCPFHSEKTPSFTVSPTKQFYHCFGCGAHGTALGFLMEYEHMSFPDAVAALAQDVGLPIPESAQEPDRPRPPPALWDALEQAAQLYKQQLKQTPHAIDYLKGRGLTGAIAARYGIGYAPDGSPLKQVFADYSADALAASGLVIDGDRGRYDRFRDRIMFPIRNIKGQIIGFGGRVLDKGEPKYLNSPETPLFHKGAELYGLFEARAAIKAAGRAIVVEGYMDVVALAQHGVEFAVAALGTATTPIHVRTLLRHTDRLIYAFDGDNAGRKAAWRALENSLEALQDGKEVSFLFLPEGEDPDSYIRTHGQAAFLQLLDTDTLPLSAFLVRELSRNRKLDSPGRPRRPVQGGQTPAGKNCRAAAGQPDPAANRRTGALAGRRTQPMGMKTQCRPACRAAAPATPPGAVARAQSGPYAVDEPAAGCRSRTVLARRQRSAERSALTELMDWLREVESLSLPALAEAARGSAMECLVDELMTDLLDKDDSWDWNAEFDGAVKQLRDDWRRRRQQELLHGH